MRVGEISSQNSSTTPLPANGTFTGTWQQVYFYPSVTVAALASHSGTLYAQFSHDGVSLSEEFVFPVAALESEVHRLTVTRAYFRVVYVNGSTAQTSFHVQTLLSNAEVLTSQFRSTVNLDTDAIITRSLDMEFDITLGKLSGYSVNNKAGRNQDIDAGTTPEDVWDAGGIYTGFPVSSLETITVVSSSANDTAAGSGARTVNMVGLDADYNISSETLTLNGTFGATTTKQFRRLHTANVVSAGPDNLAFNAGTLTFRHTTTTANIFLTMNPGRNQTNCSAYTVPAGFTGVIRRVSASIIGGTSNAVEGALWVRVFGASPRLRRPFGVSSSYVYNDEIYGGLSLPEKTDVVVRAVSATANNLDLVTKYDIVLIRN